MKALIIILTKQADTLGLLTGLLVTAVANMVERDCSHLRDV